MASGGSSGRLMSGTRSFDFGSDDLLCSYGDYSSQQDQMVNGKRSDISAKDLHDNIVRRPLANVYGQPEDFPREDVISAVEKCMKKYADNLMRCLEGIGGRLTQLELYCYKLERSLNEFQADMTREQSESVVNIKSLEKEVHEVHRCVQIIRDKQELAETQKELTKLQFSQKEPINSTHTQRNEDFAATSMSSPERKPHTDVNDVSNQHLALTLHHQISSPSPPPQPQSQPTALAPGLQPVSASVNVPLQQDRYIPNQNSPFYSQHQPLPQQQQIQHLQPELHFAPQRPQMPDLSVQSPLQQQVGANQQQQFPQYQQQWPSSSQAQVLYPPYQTPNPIPETFQTPAPYLHPPPQYNTHRHPIPPVAVAAQAKNGLVGNNPYPSQPNVQGYNPAYAMGGSRTLPSRFQAGMSVNDPRNQYGEMIEKAVSMGYQREQVFSVLQRMGEAGQPLDFNALLDGLNAQANSGAPPRQWSG